MEENKNDTMARIDELSRQETEPAVESAEPFAQNIETVALLVRNISTKKHVVI